MLRDIKGFCSFVSDKVKVVLLDFPINLKGKLTFQWWHCLVWKRKWEKKKECVCVCVCVCEREREREKETERERQRQREREKWLNRDLDSVNTRHVRYTGKKEKPAGIVPAWFSCWHAAVGIYSPLWWMETMVNTETRHHASAYLQQAHHSHFWCSIYCACGCARCQRSRWTQSAPLGVAEEPSDARGSLSGRR